MLGRKRYFPRVKFPQKLVNTRKTIQNGKWHGHTGHQTRGFQWDQCNLYSFVFAEEPPPPNTSPKWPRHKNLDVQVAKNQDSNAKRKKKKKRPKNKNAKRRLKIINKEAIPPVTLRWNHWTFLCTFLPSFVAFIFVFAGAFLQFVSQIYFTFWLSMHLSTALNNISSM